MKEDDEGIEVNCARTNDGDKGIESDCTRTDEDDGRSVEGIEVTIAGNDDGTGPEYSSDDDCD